MPHEHKFKTFIYIEVEQGAVSNFLTENYGLLSQTRLGNILLFGKRTFGENWMKKMLRKLKVGDRTKRKN
nr:hypothetical protein [Candidatus Njordarchaeota archaeon]